MRHTEHFDVGERPRIELRVPAGSVEVHAGVPGTVDVMVDASEPSSVTVSKVGDSVSVVQGAKWGFRNRTTRVVVTAPAGTDVDATTVSADLRLLGRIGPARLRTTSGRIEADTVERLDLTTTSGDVRIREVAEDADVHTVSGDCQVGTVGGRLVASLVSGGLRTGRVTGDLRAGTTSGALRVECCSGSDVSLKSISGDVELGLPPGITVEADLSTLSGRATLPSAEPRDPSRPRRTVRLTVRTVSGDLTIRRVTG